MAIVDDPKNRREISRKEPEVNDLEQLAIPDPEKENPASTPPVDDGLPDKYRNKSIAEIARMHQELEQRFGQQGNEVGELRKALDTYVLSKLQEGTNATSKKEEEEEDFFTDPRKSVSKAIANDPEIQRLKNAAIRAEQLALQQSLKLKHPDYEDVLRNESFQSWIGESKIRQRLLREADEKYDIETVDELFTEFKKLNNKQQANAETVAAEKANRKNEIKKGSTGAARGAPNAARSSGQIFRRADIVELMKTNPRRYEALMPEIRKAYEEGRVR